MVYSIAAQIGEKIVRWPVEIVEGYNRVEIERKFEPTDADFAIEWRGVRVPASFQADLLYGSQDRGLSRSAQVRRVHSEDGIHWFELSVRSRNQQKDHSDVGTHRGELLRSLRVTVKDPLHRPIGAMDLSPDNIDPLCPVLIAEYPHSPSLR